jgi:hypothetical protein
MTVGMSDLTVGQKLTVGEKLTFGPKPTVERISGRPTPSQRIGRSLAEALPTAGARPQLKTHLKVF